MRQFILRGFAFAGVAGMLLAGGCDWDRDDDSDHDPAEGFGALYVDNNTGDDIRIYVNGEQVARVGDYADKVVDLEPGVYRIILDGDDTDRNFREDIDIIEGRLTVLDVAYDGSIFDDDYDVEVFFD